MVVFKKSALGAATVRADERTLSAIAGPDFAFDLRGNVARAVISVARCSWASSGRVSGLVEVLQQKLQRSIEDRSRIAIRDNMTQQILGFT
jgi:hypothetical protein